MRTTNERRTSTAPAIIGALAITVMLSGCTVSGLGPSTATAAGTGVGATGEFTASQEAAHAVVFGALQRRQDSMSMVILEERLEDLVPSHKFVVDGEKVGPLADAIVVGTVTDVQPGKGFVMVGEDSRGGTAVDFYDRDAAWRVIVVTIETDTRLGDVDAKSIRVAVTIDGFDDPDLAIESYRQLGRIAVVLNPPGKWDFDPTLYSIRWSGALIGTVSDRGRLAFPIAEHEIPGFVGELDTVAELVAENRSQAPVTKVELSDGSYDRKRD